MCDAVPTRQWEFGQFAALFVVLGLNDNQTNGRSEAEVVAILGEPEPSSEITGGSASIIVGLANREGVT